MAVPKKKVSRSKGKMRRSHYKCERPGLSKCPKCKAFKEAHRVCTFCGSYNGKEVLAATA